MYGRWFQGLVVASWLTSMTWLVATKLAPPMIGGDPPDYSTGLVQDARGVQSSVWRLRWREQTIGYVAAETISRGPAATVYSLARFEKLPVGALLDDLFGAVAMMVKPWLGNDTAWDVDLVVASRVRYDDQRRLHCFDTRVDLPSLPDFLTVQGAVGADGALRLEARLDDGAAATGDHLAPPIVSHTIPLPPGALVENGLLPRSRLSDLYVGQTWTVPLVRSFPPNSPVQLVEVRVERLDVIFWDGEDVETFLVVYRQDVGSGVPETRQPVGYEWVRPDGTILRQEVAFSNLRLTFERLPDDAINPLAELLAEQRAGRWSEDGTE